MADLHASITKHANLPLADQKHAGKAISGKMDDTHEDFLAMVIALLDRKEIDSRKPDSLLKMDVYDKLPADRKTRVDLALPNITDQLRQIEDFFRSKQTPNSSPHLQTMIEHLWRMKERIEKDDDVFKF